MKLNIVQIRLNNSRLWLSVNVKLKRSPSESILLLGKIQYCLLYQNIGKDNTNNFSIFCLFFIYFDDILNILFGFPLTLNPITKQLILQTVKPTFGHLSEVSKISNYNKYRYSG